MDHFVNSVESQKYVCRRHDMLTSLVTLEEGFYRTLVLCPWFACKIQSSGFNRATWPDGLVPVGPVPCPDKATGKIKLLHIHVVRLKDNSGMVISVNFNHGVADDETRALVNGRPAKQLSTKSRVADFILWLSPNKRTRLIDGLRSQVLEHLPHGTRLSTNDVISAVLHRVHEQSVNGAAGEHCTSVIVDHPSMNYMGNPVFGELAHQPITAKTISVLVTTTTNTVASAKMYAADFGNGVQAYSTTHPELSMGVFVILPSPPPSNDILVNICDASSVMDGVLKNEFWSDFAEMIY
ncbi:hypothetical protein DL89DRAFT_270086 [Linderina pennispora]|uniref:CoA-dependent acyltransferase n=1 Tax=Linderina pennispora TaxID=61395 RepID=A0A1Y1VZ63_9FUNG|nr:uncharacterized protein DL89DRAFT_270086 [Linderina pennispora]ORX66549.1 hypothetical protein DL89DRAFT_270086 [Linderina pennispora]